MKTTKLIQLCSIVFMLSFTTSMYSQSLGDVIKKEAKKVADKIDGKKKKKKSTDVITNGNHKPIDNFISGNMVFMDNFDNERAGEFPSKWTHLSGTLQNAQMPIFGKREGVAQFISSSSMKPTFNNDDYLGDSFKIEGQFFFHGRGNESYTLNLMNNNDPYRAYQITIRGDGIVPAGSSSEYARMPNKLPSPGWRTVQLSFNKGVLKVFYEGYQLINIPDLKKTNDRDIDRFTHLELSALSSSSSNYKAMINYIAIAHRGLPLYKRLVTEGRLIFYDILFDNDSYFIKPSSYPTIDRIANMLKENPGISIQIEGHTDSNGTRESNQVLSENRAKAVMYYLKNKGININRLSTVGFGEDKPIAFGNNEEAWMKNRRVEIVYMH